MRGLFADLAGFADSGEAVATATVVAARGSTPRGVGAKMIVRSNGSTLGSIGGGCGEAQVFWEAARVLEEGRPRLCEVDLTGELNDDSPTNCGGIMQVFVDCSRWEQTAETGLGAKDLLRLVGTAAAARRALAVLTVVAAKRGVSAIRVGSKWAAESDGSIHGSPPTELRLALRETALEAFGAGRARCVWLRRSADAWKPSTEKEGELAVFVEALAPQPELIIVGAGHIALQLARMGALLDFEVVVVDDRGAYANRERFPEADHILVGPIEQILRARTVGPASYVVLVTRGHQHDEAALKAVIGSGAAYIGMIGSRRRIREIFRHLEQAGVRQDLFSRVHAPIGLRIDAETPAEIAVAIAAELVKARRGAAKAGISARAA